MAPKNSGTDSSTSCCRENTHLPVRINHCSLFTSLFPNSILSPSLSSPSEAVIHLHFFFSASLSLSHPHSLGWTFECTAVRRSTGLWISPVVLNFWCDLWAVSPQMDPVQKAVMTHTFGPPMMKTKRPIISCNVCQIRFNSEVWQLKQFQNRVAFMAIKILLTDHLQNSQHKQQLFFSIGLA